MARLLLMLAVAMLGNGDTVFAQDLQRCSYMNDIPRPPKPDDLPDLNFEGKPWKEQPLVPGPERDDVCMDAYYPGTDTGTQVILMDEEIKDAVPIAKLNYQGSATPFVRRPIVSGTFEMLGPEIRNVEGSWLLYITRRQDYETEVMRSYMFEIEVPGETLVVSVSLQINNIDDNPPRIEVFKNCVIPELKEPGPTSCVYEVTDEDGRLSTSAMSFTITSDRYDDKVFNIIKGDISADWKKMTITIEHTVALDYEKNALHIFQITAKDSKPNEHTVTIMVQVENVEHRVPRWVEIFAVQQYNEKIEKKFNVIAIDGDTGINKPIYYKVEAKNSEDAQYFDITTREGGYQGAILTVKPIDRDRVERELFPISITAYKRDNETLATTADVVIIIDDVNDNKPEPLQAEYTISIMEETAQTLNFDIEFGFHDKDLGQNAQYTVRLETDPPGIEGAFFIAPQVGYQKQTFILGTQNHTMLDYEEPAFQKIKLRVIATDINRPEDYGVAVVNIELINWNDELPIFEKASQEVAFDETEGEGFFVGTVLATDRDIGDKVEHSLLGNAQNYLTINITTGEIYVSTDNAFDYERQSEIFVQVQATDTLGQPYNTDTSQLIIKLNDINNSPPKLTLPRRSPQVPENSPAGTVITEEITAIDSDTSADLNFEIIWDTSYATKQGRQTPASEYRECVEIKTSYPETHTRYAVGKITVKELRPSVTIDYEEFEMLYLTIRVEDRNTKIGDRYDETTFTVTIKDVNDNAPIWAEGTLTKALSVRENSKSNTVIGSVLATDIDGPLYNQIKYSLRTRSGTPENLIKIDPNTGQLSVEKDGAIDADEPRYNLYYTVIASDQCLTSECPEDEKYHETEGEIAIAIIDTNNKEPTPDNSKFDLTVEMYENAETNETITTLAANDLDRDEIYKTVRYQIQYVVNPRLRDFFAVDLNSGRFYVDYTTEEVLDRDGDESQHEVFFTLIDNFYSDGDGNRNTVQLKMLVVLLDVNDNAPQLPDRSSLTWSVSEGLLKGEKLSPIINAPDRDKPNTPNSQVGYEISSIALTNRDVDAATLFEIVTSFDDELSNNIGQLQTLVDLKGHWGTYSIGIRAFDHGDPKQTSEQTFTLVINPYNFNDPVFVFPTPNSVIRLATERAELNGVLVTVDGAFLNRVQATDKDGLEAGRVTFEVIGNDVATQFFKVENDRENSGILMLTQAFTEKIREFEITIRATDQGTDPAPRSTDTTIKVVFVPTQGEPEFKQSTTTVTFIEKEKDQRQQLVLAEDPKNYLCEGDKCYPIYYKIIDGNTDGLFGVEETENVLYLLKELDRTVATSHTIRIAASNSKSESTPLPASILTVTVNVRESNPLPNFEKELYTAGISTVDSINREILTVSARHSENAVLTYAIDMSTMVADPSLQAVKDYAFEMNPSTGVIVLKIQPTASMHGMFEFKVTATAPDGGKDEADVKIYLISSQNRVFFMFLNTLEQIEEKKAFIASTFTTGFSMTCNIDQILPATDENGVARTDVTEVRAHFIQNNEPVNVEVIEKLRSDPLLLTSIQRALTTELLFLQDLVTGDSPTIQADTSLILVYTLGAIAIVLGLLCIILLVLFIVKTRALNRELQALSMTKYGSQESGLNRAGLAAPGTNKFAEAGSNPIWNAAIKAPDFDAISEDSDDSDLIGIEDLPQFRSDYFPPADTNSDQAIFREEPKLATHDNNFGFNPTPFSSEFANTFRR